jgi:hypothetical protein
MLTVADRVEIAQGLKAGWSIRATPACTNAHSGALRSVLQRRKFPSRKVAVVSGSAGQSEMAA